MKQAKDQETYNKLEAQLPDMAIDPRFIDLVAEYVTTAGNPEASSDLLDFLNVWLADTIGYIDPSNPVASIERE